MKNYKFLLLLGLVLILSFALFGCIDVVFMADHNASTVTDVYFISSDYQVIEELYQQAAMQHLYPSRIQFSGKMGMFSVQPDADSILNDAFACSKKNGKYYFHLVLTALMDLNDRGTRISLTALPNYGISILPASLGKVKKVEVYINKRKVAQFGPVDLSNTYCRLTWDKIYAAYDLDGRAFITYVVTK